MVEWSQLLSGPTVIVAAVDKAGMLQKNIAKPANADSCDRLFRYCLRVDGAGTSVCFMLRTNSTNIDTPNEYSQVYVQYIIFSRQNRKAIDVLLVLYNKSMCSKEASGVKS